jgi:putative ABC transport system permease protein
MKQSFGIRVSVLGRFYLWRIREHGVQELLAAAGIAVGVALVFGVLLANTSLTGSTAQLVHGIVGDARLQLSARSADGFDQQLATQASTLPGVARAAPIVRGDIAVVGPTGARRSLQLVGVTTALARLGGVQTEDFGPGGLRLSDGLTLPAPLAETIGARPGRRVTVLADGHAHRVVVGSVLDSETIGALADSPVGIALLPVAQSLLGVPDRVTQLLIEPEPGADARLARELRSFAGGRLFVGPADADLRALELTAAPNDQSTTLFAGISAMVGLLLAVNAMLLTMPERRRFIAELRTQGFDPKQVLLVLTFEAILLGVLASAAGILLGDVLSRTLFDEVPAYLAFAFPIGTQRIIELSTVAIAFGGGVLATVVASAPPALDLLPGRSADAIYRDADEGEPGEGVSPRLTRALVLAAVVVVLGSTLIALVVPSLTIIAGVALAVATLCLIPAAFTAVARPLETIARRIRGRGNMLAVAVMELRATSTRSIALASVAAIAVYGSVAIEGAHHDLVRGLDRNFGQYLSTADLWITTGGNDLTTNSFDADGLAAAIERTPGVKRVRPYQGGLLDVGDRRVWIIARSSSDPAMIPPSQLVSGSLHRATRQLREGGWASVSDVFAKAHGLDVGSTFSLPAPAGQLDLRVAAITTNLGWPPGGVILNSSDYRRGWETNDPSALQIDLEPGTDSVAARGAVAAAIGDRPGLRIQTLAERQQQYASLSRQALTSLSQISTLLVIAAALAVAAALWAAIWQRRPRLAALKTQGFDQWQLWRALLLEAAIVLVVGCVVGALLGIYGHALASRYLQMTTGFPAPFSLAPKELLYALAGVAGTALVVVALPGWLAAKVPARVSFQE